MTSSPTRNQTVRSWGNVHGGEHLVFEFRERSSPFPRIDLRYTVLPFGNGRSYGDSCLNVGGVLLSSRLLNNIIDFDEGNGILRCESGVLLLEILRLVVPRGWFLPVVPGTQYVTVGGAIGNDIHGKNHHRAGTFGRFVRKLELLRSNESRLVCSPVENSNLFGATIGGLGMTGFITWAELQLRRISSPWIEVETIRFSCLAEFCELSSESSSDYEYIVGWVDGLSRGKRLGRGILQRANHSEEQRPQHRARDAQFTMPYTPPFSLINTASVQAFNAVNYCLRASLPKRTVQHFRSFFFRWITSCTGIVYMDLVDFISISALFRWRHHSTPCLRY